MFFPTLKSQASKPAEHQNEGSGSTRLSLPLVIIDSKPGAGPSTFPDGTGVDNDRPNKQVKQALVAAATIVVEPTYRFLKK